MFCCVPACFPQLSRTGVNKEARGHRFENRLMGNPRDLTRALWLVSDVHVKLSRDPAQRDAEGPRVLLVDDNPAISSIAEAMLFPAVPCRRHGQEWPRSARCVPLPATGRSRAGYLDARVTWSRRRTATSCRTVVGADRISERIHG